jgi:hypothetical protein
VRSKAVPSPVTSTNLLRWSLYTTHPGYVTTLHPSIEVCGIRLGASSLYDPTEYKHAQADDHCRSQAENAATSPPPLSWSAEQINLFPQNH